MRFFIDESGDFRVDDDGVGRVGIIVGITIPEIAEAEALAKYDEFVATLPPGMFKHGEPKGSLLTLSDRTRFAQMIANNPYIIVTPSILDIHSLTRAGRQVRAGLVYHMHNMANRCIHAQLQDQVHLLARQIDNLSDNQTLRICSIAYCFKRAFEQTLILQSDKEYYECWHNMRFEIDPAGVRSGNREEQVFKWAMLGWLQGWSQKDPIITILEIHTKEHPLIKNYTASDGKFNLKKIFGDNLHYPRSSESKGLQIADMAASIVHHALNGVVAHEDLDNYGLLLRNNLWAPRYSHGLFCLTDPLDVDLRRYTGLTEAVAKSRELASVRVVA